MIFFITLLVAWLLNLYIILFGKRDLEALKSKISVKKYLSEINASLTTMMGDTYTTILKISLVILAIVFVIFNAFAFLQCLGGIILGTFFAERSYKVPSISNILNKITTYINRLR